MLNGKALHIAHVKRRIQMTHAGDAQIAAEAAHNHIDAPRSADRKSAHGIVTQVSRTLRGQAKRDASKPFGRRPDGLIKS